MKYWEKNGVIGDVIVDYELRKEFMVEQSQYGKPQFRVFLDLRKKNPFAVINQDDIPHNPTIPIEAWWELLDDMNQHRVMGATS